MNTREELMRLLGDIAPNDIPGGVGIARVSGVAASNPSVVLDRCREVMRAVLEDAEGGWPTVDEWKLRLPKFFVEAAAPERSTKAAEHWLAEWRGLSPAEQAVASRAAPWSLADWLYWMEPERREWYWWDAGTDGRAQLWVDVQVDGWPTAVGALRWLLRAAGALDVSDPE